MNLHTLPKLTHKTKKRGGQGHGSGRGKTAGRGTKGQKARGSIGLFFEGGALPLIKRLPFRRGKNKNKVFKKKPVIINLKILNMFPANTVVDLDLLIKSHIVEEIDARKFTVKILGEGTLTIPLVIKLPMSRAASEKIKKAGGTVEA